MPETLEALAGLGHTITLEQICREGADRIASRIPTDWTTGLRWAVIERTDGRFGTVPLLLGPFAEEDDARIAESYAHAYGARYIDALTARELAHAAAITGGPPPIDADDPFPSGCPSAERCSCGSICELREAAESWQ